LRHSVNGRVHKFRPIRVRHQLYIRRENAPIQCSDLRVHTFQNLRWVHSPEKKDNTGHAVGILIHPENSTALKGSKLQSAEIFEKDRCSVLSENHDIAEVLQRPNETDSANDVTLFSSIDNAPARVGIVSLDSGRYLRQRDVVLSKLCGVGDELELCRFAPKFVTSATPVTCLRRGMTTHS
jgi:hypothetical protein